MVLNVGNPAIHNHENAFRAEDVVAVLFVLRQKLKRVLQQPLGFTLIPSCGFRGIFINPTRGNRPPREGPASAETEEVRTTGLFSLS